MTTLKLSEAQLQEKVIDLAKARGWLVHHSRPAQTLKGWRTPVSGHVGFPDLVLARDGVVLFVELKSDSGRLTGQQKTWLAQLTAVGEPDCDTARSVRVWRPVDWPEVEAVLA